MIAVAKNLGEAPLFYGELVPHDDGTVSVKRADGKYASQQPTAGHPYAAAYGLFGWVDSVGEWEKAKLRGQIITFSVNGELFGYCWY